MGVLAQDRDAVRRYIEETGLPFDILIDERRDMAEAYGVWHRVGIDALNIARPGGVPDRPGRDDPVSFIGDNQTRVPDAGRNLPRRSGDNRNCESG